MFADSPDGLAKYGDTLYTVNSKSLIDVRYVIRGFYTGELKRSPMVSFPQTMDPCHIVISAEFWDIPSCVLWFIRSIAIPHNIKGVKTRDGAIVFDSSIIQREEKL